MAYSDDIDALLPTNRFDLDTTANDLIGTANGVNSGGQFTGTALCEGVSNSWTTNGTNDRITLPSGNGIENSTSKKSVGGWFSATGIQNPPKSIYGEGNTTTSLRFILGWGNYLVFEVDTDDFTLQIFADVPLEINRPYHLYMEFRGSLNNNEFSAYLDGVKQLDATPIDRQPNTELLTARNVIEFGDPAGVVSVGGTEVILLAPINGQYNQWAMFSDGLVTSTQIRKDLFEKGALPDVVVTNQVELDSIANSIRGNSPLCIRVDVPGSINLIANNIKFNPLASIHIQYTGTGTLNWTNTNGANAVIGSTPNNGTLNFINPAVLTITGLILGAEFRIYDNELIDGNNMNTELAGVESLTNTFFSLSHTGVANEIRIQMIAEGFEETSNNFTLNSSNQSLTILPTVDANS